MGSAPPRLRAAATRRPARRRYDFPKRTACCLRAGVSVLAQLKSCNRFRDLWIANYVIVAARAVAYPAGMSELLKYAERFRGFLPVVVDIETGGFDSERDALLEIAAVIVRMDEHGVVHPAPVVS